LKESHEGKEQLSSSLLQYLSTLLLPYRVFCLSLWSKQKLERTTQNNLNSQTKTVSRISCPVS